MKHSTNHALLNSADYRKISNIKNLLKNYHVLEQFAERGDMDALCIFVDLTTVLYSRDILTPKQLRCVEEVYLNGTPQERVAVDLGISRQAVGKHLRNALHKIRSALNSGNLYKNVGNTKDKDIAEEWLKLNDPNYYNNTKDKGIERSYLTERQEKRRKSKEVLSGDVTDVYKRQRNKGC